MSLATITTLYAAFSRLDGDAMAACHAEAARFTDEVFTLQGRQQPGGLWRMLCGATGAKAPADWKLETSGISEQGGRGRAHRKAHCRFSATGRLVHHVFEAEFEFDKAGLIPRPLDRFDFWRWARQALGTPGLLLGWTRFLRAKVRAQATADLQCFLGRPA